MEPTDPERKKRNGKADLAVKKEGKKQQQTKSKDAKVSPAPKGKPKQASKRQANDDGHEGKRKKPKKS